MDTAACNSVAHHSAKFKVFRAMMFAVRQARPLPRRPCGRCRERSRVRKLRSRAREKVAHGGAK